MLNVRKLFGVLYSSRKFSVEILNAADIYVKMGFILTCSLLVGVGLAALVVDKMTLTYALKAN